MNTSARTRGFPALLLKARRESGLSQRDLAARAKTTQAVIARIELNQVSPTVDTITRLLDAAGFELEANVVPKAVLDRQVLDDVPRILALTPENRLREVANLNRFVSVGRRRG
jgi:predicted transcriptional regulator